MSAKSSKNKKTIKAAKTKPANQNRIAQILFAIFAVILILSMVLSAVTNF